MAVGAGRRGRAAAATAGLAVALASQWAVLGEGEIGVTAAVAGVLATIGFLGIGLYAWHRRPGSRTGPLLVLCGLSLAPIHLLYVDEPVLRSIGLMALPTFGAPLVHLLVAFPSGRPVCTRHRLLVAYAYFYVTVQWWVVLLFYAPPEDCGPACLAEPAIAVLADRDVYEALVVPQAAAGSALAVAAIAVLLRRWLRAAPAGRRTLRPVVVAGGLSAALASVFTPVAYSHMVDGEVAPLVAQVAWDVAWLAVPLTALASLLRSRASRLDLPGLLAELERDRRPLGLRDTVARVLGDPTLELGFRVEDAPGWYDAHGRPLVHGRGQDGRTATVLPGGDVAFLHDSALHEEDGLLEAVGAATAMALENERLHADVRARLEEVRAARARIVAAGDETRRRIERDLHDGAQQTVVTLELALRMLGDALEDLARADLAAGAREGGALAARARDELRDLARGIFPALLAVDGLPAALEELAMGAPLRVAVHAPLPGRPDPAVETTAYFAVREAIGALSAADRPGEALCARVEAVAEDDELVLTITPMGLTGGRVPAPPPADGELADRVAAVGGRMEHGGNSWLRLRLPWRVPDGRAPARPPARGAGDAPVRLAGGVARDASGRRRPLLAGAAVTALVVAVEAVAIATGAIPLTVGVADTVSVAGFAWAGVFAWRRRPDSNVGPLLLLAGAGLAPVNLLFVGDVPALRTVGLMALGCFAAPLVHLMITFPRGRLRDARERLGVMFSYAWVTLGWWGVLVLYEPPEGCAGCLGPTVFSFLGDRAVFAPLRFVHAVVTAAIALWVLAVVARRWRTASPAARRVHRPVLAAGGFVAFAVLVTAPFAYAMIDGELAATPLQAGWALLFIALPVTILAGFLRTRASRLHLARLFDDLGGELPPLGLREVLARALGDPSLEVGFAVPDVEGYRDARGRPLRSPPPGVQRAYTALDDGPQPAVVLVHDPVLYEDEGLVDAAGAAARLALEHERLHAQVRSRLREAHAARERLVTAGDRARRRLERELHDGPQQTLVSLALAVRMLSEDVRETGDEELAALCDGAAELVDRALGELRDLARGVYPAVLTVDGLAAALDELEVPAPLELRLDVDLPGRAAPEVEAAGWFFCREGLANVVKHAAARHVAVRARVEGATLELEVADDGCGGAREHGGSGLSGLADRVAAHGGALEVHSPPGAGTRLVARLPWRPRAAPRPALLPAPAPTAAPSR